MYVRVGVNGQSGSGQAYSVTITASPNGSFYAVGDLITLQCIVDPPITSTTTIVTYSWKCNGCFADGYTDMVIMRQLTESDMDTSLISCSATVNGVKFMTDIPFDLQVTQGMVRIYLQHVCKKGSCWLLVHQTIITHSYVCTCARLVLHVCTLYLYSEICEVWQVDVDLLEKIYIIWQLTQFTRPFKQFLHHNNK